jgi:hypothetical protein
MDTSFSESRNKLRILTEGKGEVKSKKVKGKSEAEATFN